uniref:Uncharacterized protein n=1 Tax=Globisporangium ultimum (strain ATCC 200006 / CBS 805.95 / DAOM BR144) TaxID=431595 RepID=K3WJE0_GLOUD
MTGIHRIWRTTCRALAAAYASVSTGRGAYSAERLVVFHAYCESAPRWRAFLLIVLSWLPTFVIVLLIDVLPLQDPRESWKANVTLWIRAGIIAFANCGGVLLKMKKVIPSLRFTACKVPTIMTCVSIGYTSILMMLAAWWGFPIPFMFTLGRTPFGILCASFTLIVVTTDAAQHTKLKKFFVTVSVQISMVLVYPSCNAVFLRLEGHAQLAFVLVFPVAKVMYKLILAHLARDLGDLRPAIVSCVDFFDALYMIKCMQTASTVWVSAGIIAVDVTQNHVALLFLHRQFHVLRDLLLRRQAPSVPGQEDIHDLVALVRSLVMNRASVPHANNNLLSLSSIAEDEFDILRERQHHRRPSWHQWPSNDPGKKLFLLKVIQPNRLVAPFPMVSPSLQAAKSCPLHLMRPTVIVPEIRRTSASQQPMAEENTMLIRETLQLLHQVERIVVVEFIETVVPIFYAIYITILFQLPNARYYQDMGVLTEAKLQSVILSILIYAALKLLTIIHLYCTLKRNFGISVFYQLAFTLEKEWQVYHYNFQDWTLVVFQFMLVHTGTDFSFKFEWLCEDQ